MTPAPAFVMFFGLIMVLIGTVDKGVWITPAPAFVMFFGLIMVLIGTVDKGV
jgi:hypothetical protein